MPKPIDDTEMLVTLAEDIVAGRAETPTGAMRLHGVERGSGQERRLLKKWAVHGDVLVKVVHRARPIMDDGDMLEAAYARGYHAGVQAERDAAMIAGTSALAQPAFQAYGDNTVGSPGTFVETPPRRPSLWQRLIGVAG